MDTKKKSGLLAVGLVCAVALAACGGKSSDGDSAKKSSAPTTYKYVYSTDPDTFDYTVTSRATNSDQLKNWEDGLLETNQYGELEGALAKSYDVSKDGLTYTFHLRKGAKWSDSEGNPVADVTADDFVTGLKHAVDSKSETLYVVQDSIKGLGDYISGKDKNFDDVGVKATDKYTVEYTLNQPESYFPSKTTYGVMYPVYGKFLKQQGKNFGKASADAILYNGAYILKNFTAKSVIEFSANPNYWDKKNVHVKDVKLTFNDGSDPDGLYKSFKKGNYSAARVYPANASYKTVEKQDGKNIVWSDQGAATYNMTFNLNRKSYHATSKTTAAQKTSTKDAILNQNFRLAIQFALDKGSYNAQTNGKAAATKALRNTWTPYNFVNVDGKPYGELVASETKALNKDAFGDIDYTDGNNSSFNAAKAKTYFAKAVKELGSKVSLPIHLDIAVPESSAPTVNSAKSIKESVEASLGKKNVVIDIQMLNEDKYLAATYAATAGKASDFDISTASGWSPDYQDPSTYLDVYKPSAGSSLITLGLDAESSGNATAETKAVEKTTGLDKLETLLDKAEAITQDVNARYEAFAKAEAQFNNSAVQIPMVSDGGTPSVTKVVPYTRAYSWSGSVAPTFKFMKLQAKTVTTKQFNKAKAAWQAKRTEIAKENQN
ncbi:peptide ABC transporter substrate-binding protein [Lacticaseibacillus kribbianus]|uniref:peptide ABC transporter substrate-binding protein n=1 Tax=Lacticaseibacillus kribbianus TaxID=2926292 RepID=UPI001CD676A4|nr:peptide ABC transporter substrate-binding protein [Lacticaseibacillus kribbianus]